MVAPSPSSFLSSPTTPSEGCTITCGDTETPTYDAGLENGLVLHNLHNAVGEAAEIVVVVINAVVPSPRPLVFSGRRGGVAST